MSSDSFSGVTDNGQSRAIGAPRCTVRRGHRPDRQALHGLRFGEVSVIVQDGVVVQLERRERKRLRSSQQ